MHNARIRPSYDFLGITQRLRDAICFHTESLHCRCLVEANGESPPPTRSNTRLSLAKRATRFIFLSKVTLIPYSPWIVRLTYKFNSRKKRWNLT